MSCNSNSDRVSIIYIENLPVDFKGIRADYPQRASAKLYYKTFEETLKFLQQLPRPIFRNQSEYMLSIKVGAENEPDHPVFNENKYHSPFYPQVLVLFLVGLPEGTTDIDIPRFIAFAGAHKHIDSMRIQDSRWVAIKFTDQQAYDRVFTAFRHGFSVTNDVNNTSEVRVGEFESDIVRFVFGV